MGRAPSANRFTPAALRVAVPSPVERRLVGTQRRKFPHTTGAGLGHAAASHTRSRMGIAGRARRNSARLRGVNLSRRWDRNGTAARDRAAGAEMRLIWISSCGTCNLSVACRDARMKHSIGNPAFRPLREAEFGPAARKPGIWAEVCGLDQSTGRRAGAKRGRCSCWAGWHGAESIRSFCDSEPNRFRKLSASRCEGPTPFAGCKFAIAAFIMTR